ncbi:hypothetical protein NQ317_008750 [Molorchus minor]|uniref:Fatty acid desaturase domain-containing protein n=1 Tax=Molorchus minor TaxID=1323400 RepID=A0ABQ9J335_9CUCU|nr:hypothetical protein NQ317_008750 [Molorchus minor]
MTSKQRKISETIREHKQNGSQKMETLEVKPQHPRTLVWRNIILYILMHIGAFYGLQRIITLNTNWKTILWCYLMIVVGLQGITSGVHRLWTHKSYKAKLPLRILLCIFNTIALQLPIYTWVKDHRAHHKYSDTDADPHNSKRGVFYSHVGWLFVEQTKDCIEKTAAIDMSDIHEDGVVLLYVICTIIGFYLPACVPYYFWGEDFWRSFYVVSMLRYALTTHITFLVNSLAHKYGSRPYDGNIPPTDNLTITMLTGGEGWHNYHHTFPWDYKAGELGKYSTNWSTGFIDFMAKIGWAYDLKTVSMEMINKRCNRTGDGSRKFDGDQEKEVNNKEETLLWGWGDKDMTEEELKLVEIHHKLNEKVI